jgi:hypothetical protein
MAQQSLIDSFLTPMVAPSPDYMPGEHTVAWRLASNASIALEIFVRDDHTYGFRYAAWVAWRDAGGQVRSHGWWRIAPDSGLIADTVETSCRVAEQHAMSKQVEFELPWHLASGPPSAGPRG